MTQTRIQLSPAAQHLVDTAELKGEMPAIEHFDADDRISTGFDAELCGTFFVTAKLPGILNDLGDIQQACDDAIDAIAASLIESHASDFTASDPTALLIGNPSVFATGANEMGVALTLKVCTYLTRD